MHTQGCGCAKSRYLAMRMLVSGDWVSEPTLSHCYACYMLTIFSFVESIYRALCGVHTGSSSRARFGKARDTYFHIS
jgi:hypothetical protein